jgi:hypothetical protein
MTTAPETSTDVAAVQRLSQRKKLGLKECS